MPPRTTGNCLHCSLAASGFWPSDDILCTVATSNSTVVDTRDTCSTGRRHTNPSFLQRMGKPHGKCRCSACFKVSAHLNFPPSLATPPPSIGLQIAMSVALRAFCLSRRTSHSQFVYILWLRQTYLVVETRNKKLCDMCTIYVSQCLCVCVCQPSSPCSQPKLWHRFSLARGLMLVLVHLWRGRLWWCCSCRLRGCCSSGVRSRARCIALNFRSRGCAHRLPEDFRLRG